MTTTAVGRTYSIGEVSERTGISTHTLRLKLRSTGMPLPEIRRYAELIREGSGTVKERFRLLREHEARVRRQLSGRAVDDRGQGRLLRRSARRGRRGRAVGARTRARVRSSQRGARD